MSFLVSASVVRLKAPGVAKNVLMQLAEIANDEGYAWPSIEYLCMRTCWKRTAVIEGLEWLERHGAIRPDRSNGRKTVYWITPSRFTGEWFPELSTERNRAAKRTGSTGTPNVPVRPNPSAKRTEPVRQTDTSNQEPKKNTNTPLPPKGGEHRQEPRRRDAVVDLPPGLAAIAAAYGRRAGMPQAVQQWRALNPDEALQAEMLRAIGAWKRSDEWQRKEGQFQPALWKWLRDKRWLDAPGTAATNPSLVVSSGAVADTRTPEQVEADRAAAEAARLRARQLVANARGQRAVPA